MLTHVQAYLSSLHSQAPKYKTLESISKSELNTTVFVMLWPQYKGCQGQVKKGSPLLAGHGIFEIELIIQKHPKKIYFEINSTDSFEFSNWRCKYATLVSGNSNSNSNNILSHRSS